MHISLKKKNYTALLLLALSGFSLIYGGCKMPDKTNDTNKSTNDQTVEEPEQLPPVSVWDGIDSMSQNLAAFDTIHIKGKVLVQMKTGTKYELKKTDITQFGQKDNELYFTGKGIVTVTVPKANTKTAIPELKVTLENEAWLHFLSTFAGAIETFTVNMQKGLLTSYSTYDLHKFSLVAKDNSVINLYLTEPTQVLSFDLRNGTKASVQANTTYSKNLHIKDSSFIDSTSSLEAYQTVFKDKLNNALPEEVKQYITYFSKVIPKYTPIPTTYE